MVQYRVPTTVPSGASGVVGIGQKASFQNFQIDLNF